MDHAEDASVDKNALEAPTISALNRAEDSFGKTRSNKGQRRCQVKLTKGTVLAHKRKRAGIEQAALAAALGISASALCKMEKGQREHDWTRFDTAHDDDASSK
jgi:DNA-binding XRE family transcriptional regulator